MGFKYFLDFKLLKGWEVVSKYLLTYLCVQLDKNPEVVASTENDCTLLVIN